MEENTGSNFSILTSKVEFIEVRDQYSNQEDLLCKFKTNDYKTVEGDRIGIYKSGWLFIKDYYLFDWASPETYKVTFNKHCLPQDENEFFQFCYISVENEVLGASEPFQFVSRRMRESASEVTETSKQDNDNSSDGHSGIMSKMHEKEMQKLREENEILKESLKMFLVSHKTPRNYDRDINELKSMIYSLKNVVHKQRADIDFLKTQVRICIDCNRNLLEENNELEKQHRTCTNSIHSSSNSTEDSLKDFDLGELESIPPFPFAK